MFVVVKKNKKLVFFSIAILLALDRVCCEKNNKVSVFFISIQICFIYSYKSYFAFDISIFFEYK